MHFALLPCLVCAALGATAGWIWRDRDFYKSKDASIADADNANDDNTAENA